MEYILSNYTYTCNLLDSIGDVAYFSKNGNTYYFNLLNDSDYSGEGTYYISEKNNIEDNIYHYVNHISTQVSEGLMYGYVYRDSDYDYLCLNRQEITFFGCAYGQSGTFAIEGFEIRNNEYIGLLGQRKGILDNPTITYNTFVPNIAYDYISLEELGEDINGLFFDYDMSNYNDYRSVYQEGSVVTTYNSAFRLYENEGVLFRFGENEANNQAYYDNGYNNGYQDGKSWGLDYGEQVGYSRGYTKGLAEGGNTPVGFMSMIGGAVSQFTPVLNIEVLPNITLGTCISIPVICTLLVIIFRIARG